MLNFFKDTPVVGKSSINIEKSAIDIFKFIGTDMAQNYPRWSPEVQELNKLSPEELQKGARFKQVRIDQGTKSESIFTVNVFDEPHCVCFEGISNPFKCEYKIDSLSTNLSKLTFTFELTTLELHIRPFEKLVRIAVQDGTERTVRNIKKLIENSIG